MNNAGKVTRYNLAYINHGICGIDNGRVVGMTMHMGFITSM